MPATTIAAMVRICECRWLLLEQNDRAIKVSIFPDNRERPKWISRTAIKIRKQEGKWITFTLAYEEAKKRGLI